MRQSIFRAKKVDNDEWVRDYHNFEKRLHRRFKKKNVRGEWFKLSRLEVLFAKILIKFKKGRKNTRQPL
jgi:hypothetical protein